jgi:hypothetical protein
VDWKTSNHLYLEYLLQTAAYWQAFVEETNERVVDRWIIRLGKEDGEFDPWHAEGETLCQQDFRAFWFALRLVESIEGIEKRIQGVKEERRAAEKLIEHAKKMAAMIIKCPKADDYKGSRKSKCLSDGTQCRACKEKYDDKHPEAAEGAVGEDTSYEVQERRAIQGENEAEV